MIHYSESKWVVIFSGAVMAVLGSLVIVLSNKALDWILFLIGFTIMAVGVMHSALYFIDRTKDEPEDRGKLNRGIFECAIGALIVICRNFIAGMFPVVWGVWTLYTSVMDIIAANWIKSEGGKWQLLFGYALLRIPFAALIIFNPFTWGTAMVAVIIGSFLIVYGIMLIVLSFILRDM